MADSNFPAHLRGKRVRVHLNLHRAAAGLSDAWAVTVGGKCVAYVAQIALQGVTPKYLRTKQAFTLAGNKRTVHAWLEGTVCDAPATGSSRERVCYNPKARPLYREFHTPTGATIVGADYVVFTAERRPLGSVEFRAWAIGVRS